MLLIRVKNDRLIDFPEIDLVLVKIDQFREVIKRSQYDKSIAPLVDKLEARLKVLFKRQKNRLLDRFDALHHYFQEDSVSKDFDALLDDTLAEDERSNIDITNYASKALLLGGESLIEDLSLGIAFDLKNKRAVDYLKNYGAKLIKGVNEETRNQLHTILHNAIENGHSYSKVSAAIRAKYDDFSTSRAKRIAVTELGNAYQEGNLQAVKLAQESGLAFEKFWLTMGDNRVSDECLANTGAGWIAADDNFPSGDQRPLAHPNCRCVLQLRRAK